MYLKRPDIYSTHTSWICVCQPGREVQPKVVWKQSLGSRGLGDGVVTLPARNRRYFQGNWEGASLMVEVYHGHAPNLAKCKIQWRQLHSNDTFRRQIPCSPGRGRPCCCTCSLPPVLNSHLTAFRSATQLPGFPGGPEHLAS